MHAIYQLLISCYFCRACFIYKSISFGCPLFSNRAHQTSLLYILALNYIGTVHFNSLIESFPYITFFSKLQ